PMEDQETLHPGPTAGIGMDQVRLPILIPEGAGIDQAFALLDQYRGFPRAHGVLGPDPLDPIIRITPKDIVLVLVVADTGGPDPFAVLRPLKYIFGRDLLESMVDQAPVHQIPGVQDGEPGDGRRSEERRGGRQRWARARA